MAVKHDRRCHVLLDLWVKDPAILERVGPWREILHKAAELSGSTVIEGRFHQFEPAGVTGFLLLAESHISVHTWPEECLAVIDLFSCSHMDVDRIVDWLRFRLHPQAEHLTVLSRGVSRRSFSRILPAEGAVETS